MKLTKTEQARARQMAVKAQGQLSAKLTRNQVFGIIINADVDEKGTSLKAKYGEKAEAFTGEVLNHLGYNKLKLF